jgi:signal transduction histidine kinase
MYDRLEDVDKPTRLLNQLLTLARAEAGGLSVARAPVSLASLCRLSSRLSNRSVRAKDVSLTCDCGEEVEVAGDPRWMEQLLLNLIDNALKFTPAGGSVAVSLRADGKHGQPRRT